MKLAILAILALAAIASLMLWSRLYDYIPFVGAVQYVCSKAGVEYIVITESKAIAVHLDREGKPVNCEPMGMLL